MFAEFEVIELLGRTYAIALAVENEWAERVADVLEQASLGEPSGK